MRSVAELYADGKLKSVLGALRLRCGELVELGDVTSRNYPKMGLIGAPTAGGGLATRCFLAIVYRINLHGNWAD
jgi:4-oxalomesaconate tautomerase